MRSIERMITDGSHDSYKKPECKVQNLLNKVSSIKSQQSPSPGDTADTQNSKKELNVKDITKMNKEKR